MIPGTDIILAYSSDPAAVRRTVASLRAQTAPGWRACLCAGQAEAASMDREGDDRLIVQTRLARSQPAAWNHALAHFADTPAPGTNAPAPYLMLLWPGDELEPDALERLTKHAEATRAEGAAGAYLREPGPDQDHAPWTVRHGSAPYPTSIGLAALHTAGPIRSPACVTRREAFDRTSFGAGLAEHALYDVQLRQAERGASWAVLEAPLARRRGRWPITDLPGRAERAEHTIRRAVGRAVSAGFASAGMDLDAKREAELVMRAVLVEATLAAMLDPEPRKSKATDLVRVPWAGLEEDEDPQDGLAPRPPITPAMAADAAVAVLCELHPGDPDPEAGTWTEPLNHWWSRLVGEKWAHADLVPDARAALASRITPGDGIAREILDACRTTAGKGLGEIHAIGDPTACATLGRLGDGRPAVRVIDPAKLERDPASVKLSPDIPVVVAGRDDAEERALLGLLGPRGNVHRWRSIAQQRVEQTELALVRAWGQRMAGARY